MNKFKKLMALVMASAILLSFASCSKGKTDNNETTTVAGNMNENSVYTDPIVIEDVTVAKELFSTYFDGEKLFISQYNGNQETVTIPNKIDGQDVYGVSGSAFSSNKSVKKVIFSDGIVTLGESCFYRCDNLKEVVLPETLTYIGGNAFFMCMSLESIVIPASVEELGMGVFQSCKNLKNVTFKGFPTYFDASIFEGTAIETITIPEGIEKLFSDTFGKCQNLKTAYIPATVTYINKYTFYESPNVTIIAPAGSYAQTFAQEQGIPFQAQ